MVSKSSMAKLQIRAQRDMQAQLDAIEAKQDEILKLLKGSASKQDDILKLMVGDESDEETKKASSSSKK
ncbi:MAG: hypothetical protein ACFE0Q_20835 [Anaerolineae bacterium]